MTTPGWPDDLPDAMAVIFALAQETLATYDRLAEAGWVMNPIPHEAEVRDRLAAGRASALGPDSELRRLSEAATPGPWKVWGENERGWPLVKHAEGGAMFNVAVVNSWDRQAENVAFIVAAVNHVRAALATDSRPDSELRTAVIAAAVEWVAAHDAVSLDNPTGPPDNELLERYSEACNELLAIVSQNRTAIATDSRPDSIDAAGETYARHDFRIGGYLTAPTPEDECVWRVDGHSPYCGIARTDHDDVLARRRAGTWSWNDREAGPHEPHYGNHIGYECGLSGPHCWACNEPWPCRAALVPVEAKKGVPDAE